MTGQLITGFGGTPGFIEGDLAGIASALERLRECGANCVELYASAMVVASGGRLIPERIREMVRISEGSGLTPTLHAPVTLNFMDQDNAAVHWRAAEVSLALAEELKAPIVVFHAGRCPPLLWTKEGDDLLAHEREAFERLGEKAAAAGTKAAIENISPNSMVLSGQLTSYSLDASKLAEQLAKIEHPAITGCLDISHARQGAEIMGSDFLAGVEAMGPVTGHIHISDCTGEPAPPFAGSNIDRIFYGVGDMHAPLGWGSIDFSAVATVLSPRPGTRGILELTDVVQHQMADSIARLKSFAEQVG